MTDLIAELAEVVRLSKQASPGAWFMDDPTTADIVTNSGDVAIVLAPEMRSLDLRNGKFAALNRAGAHQNAEMIIAAVNFLRTHHAEIEAMAMDAARLEVVEDRLLTLVNAIKRAGGDPLAWSEWSDAERDAIDAAMHDSAREDSNG